MQDIRRITVRSTLRDLDGLVFIGTPQAVKNTLKILCFGREYKECRPDTLIISLN